MHRVAQYHIWQVEHSILMVHFDRLIGVEC